VRAADGYPIGAISVAAPMFRTTADELKIRSLGLLRTAAAGIARAMEASGSAN
jgi:IclR family pca regulon transcriptional regulator